MRGSRSARRGAELQEIGIIPDGAVLIRDGVIEEVGPTRRVENLAAAREAIDISAAGRVVMPGFVDSHTHLVFPPAGGPAHDVFEAARAVRAATGQRLQWRTQAHLEAMARHGTTTVEAKTGCGPDESAETKLMRVMAALKDSPLHVVPTFLFRLPNPDLTGEEGVLAAADWVLREFLPKIRRRRFARFADLAWDPDPCWHGLFSRYLESARQLGFGCKLHADRSEPSEAIATAVRHFAVTVDHLEHATPQEAACLAGSGTMATLLPLVSFYDGGRTAPARSLIDSGVPVALASNFNPHHTPTVNMQMVIALASRTLGMSPAEAITAATINGAHALGRANRVGSLEPGKLANLLILNTPDYRDLAHNYGTNIVHATMKRGALIYREGDVGPRPADELVQRPMWD
jgi:imidazolonepropionase